jgi:hypothetical protein
MPEIPETAELDRLIRALSKQADDRLVPSRVLPLANGSVHHPNPANHHQGGLG